MHTFKKLVQSSAATARQLRAVRHLRWIAAAALGPIGLVAALMTISSAGATGASISVTVLPVADTYVDAGHAKSSYGTASSLWVKGSPVNRTYLRFDLTSVATPISTATLQLYARNNSTAGFEVRSLSSGIWSEEKTTWRNAPAPDVGAGPRSGSFPGSEWVSIDVTSLVAADGIDDLVLIPGNSYAAFAVASREAGSAYAPQLVVDTGPAATTTSTTTTASTTTVPTTTTVATTATTTTTTTTPPPTSGCTPPYATAGPWNTPIDAAPTFDPDSAQYVNYLLTNTDQNILTSDPTQYSFPLFVADAATPLRTVRFNVNNPSGYGSGTYSNVYGSGSDTATNMAVTQGKWSVTLPVPAGASSANGSDGQAVVWNPATGDEWGFWQLMPDPASPGNFVATNGYHYNILWNGVPPKGFGSRGPGMPYSAGLIRPCEILQGHIDHAIAFAFRSPSSSWVYPATKSDGGNFGDAFPEVAGVTKRLPEGARLQLDPILTDGDLGILKDRHGNPCSTIDAGGVWKQTTCLIIAHALQRYGMIVADHSGRAKIYAEYSDCTTSPCSGWTAHWGQNVNGVAIPALDQYTANAIPLARFRVLKLGPLNP
jgi:hypothetical protein